MYQSWEHFDLNENIQRNLQENLNFESPTDIQKKVLVYLRSKVDLIVQAKTGEGKTLCYALPILNYILDFYQKDETKVKKLSPVALILVPTRELGIQVSQHIQAVVKDLNTELNPTGKKNYYNIKIANVLGGFAKAKQLRLLINNPEIIIATPGRLWEIMENEESPLFNKIYKLRFLVVDEADRMTEKGHFRELKSIVNFVYNKMESADSVKKSLNEDEEDKGKIKKKVLKVIPNSEVPEDQKKQENKKIKKALKQRGLNVNEDQIEEVDLMEMLADDDKLIDNFNFGEGEIEADEQEAEEEPEEAGDGIDNMDEMDVENEEFDENAEFDQNAEFDENEDDESYQEEDQEELEENENNNDEDVLNEKELKMLKRKEDKLNTELTPKSEIHLRTILCSATIEQVHIKDNKKKFRKGKDKEEEKEPTKANLDNLVKNLKFYNKLIYVKNKQEDDLDTEAFKDEKEKRSFILPEKLQLDCYRCNSSLKDYYLMHILKENEGKTIIVFDNSISHLKKIHSLFTMLDFNLTCLHSKMQQSQRIKHLDRFRRKESKILFCTDVGARGLDIPKVDLVIHYHIPKTTELFIHRSGRTARANQEGTCISLISEAEINLYKKIIKDLKLKEFAMKTLNVLQLEKYKALFEYTKKVESDDYQQKKKSREKQWFKKKAEECELIYDDEDEGGDPYAEQNEEEEKFLNKKRNLEKKDSLQNKKVYQNILANNLRRTTFLNPDMIHKLNQILANPKMKSVNLTESINQAESSKFQFKGKQKKKRYQRRRKNK